ncbi:MAG TPA: ATP-binding protein [Polyangiales bacterium]|nr:ATP-binding protein [Polyangiales bacterium]
MSRADGDEADEELERLRAEAAEKRALLDALPFATGVKDREGRWLYINAAAAAGYGSSPERMIGNREQDVLPAGNDLATLLAQDREVIDSGRSLTVPGQRFHTPEGRELILHMTRSPVSYLGQRCVLVTALDVTESSAAAAERRKLERRMAEAQRLDGLGLMAGGIAHDFNNLLVGVLANADMALRVSPTEPARTFIGRIKTAADRLAGLARQMLAYTGRDHVSVTPLDLSNLARETLELLVSNIPSQILLERDLPEQLPPIEGDQAQLSQVVMNLVINAAEAIGNRPGTIRVSARKEYLDSDRTASLAVRSVRGAMDYVCFEVSDDGPGMDAETRNRIFDPFFSTKGRTGRGLGLASVLGIVRSHQGALQVDAEPGQGTRMRLWLPLASERKRLRPSERRSVAPLEHGRSVLVVDDEPLVRDTAGAVMRLHGFEPHLAADGGAAVELAKRLGSVDLVLLDMSMPGSSVRETYAALRAVLPDAAILLTSGYNDPEVLGQLLEQPNTEFIQKPYTADRLIERCAALLP